ncbi:TSC22 domain family protein 1-like [Channa argus]|uniref:TSC22 domain family protein 1-like n=1 Tax=Channa argus TaxID=215402 RepID=UPI0035229299
MHHPDPAGDSGSVRKMAHPTVFHRRGSNTGSGSGSALSTPANPVVNNSHVSVDDYQPPLLIQCQPPAGSSSPGPHHPPPHSLNLHCQPQPTQSTGAQMKKKSGFQITSVTPAQISVSTNNSIAEDTESYDDLDESHTEDLSSSEILDVSLSRANETVGAERSSSEETLNNFHEAETPGAVSPNQPSHPHSLNQPQHHSGGMVNGTVHPQHPNHAQVYSLPSGPGSTASVLTSGALPCVTQKMPSNVGGAQENVTQTAPPNIVAQPAGIVPSGSVPGMHSSAMGSTVSIVNPQSSSVSSVNILSSASVPVRGAISTSVSSSSGGFPLNVISSSGGSGAGGGVVGAVGSNPMTTTNVSMIQQHQNVNSNIAMVNTTTTAAAVVSASGGVALSSGMQGRVGSAVIQPVSAPVTAVATAPVSSTPVQPASALATVVAATSSRFRVVKLDSSSEPFKKGRWTCTEFYDKETPASAQSSSASDTGSLSMRQFVSDSITGASERESTSGSSVSSTMSTLSHYTESGEAGGPLVPQHAQDYVSPPQGFQGILPSGLSMGISQPQIHSQDITQHVKTTVAPSVPTNIHQPAPMPGHQTTAGLPMPAVPQQQLTYAQAVANQPPSSTQGIVGVQQQKMGYVPLPQQPSAAPKAVPVQMRPPEYTQPHQGIPQVTTSQSLSNQVVSAPSGPANGACQMMAGPQQSQALLHTQPQQPSSLQTATSSIPSHVGVTGLGQQPQNVPGHLDCQQQKPQSLPTLIQNPVLGTQLSASVHQSQVSAPSVPPPNLQSDPQAQPQAHNTGNTGRMPPQGVPHSQPSSVTLPHDHSSAQSLTHAAKASALYASLPTFTTTQLQDAQRLLMQHHSVLLGQPKSSSGEAGSGSSTGQGQEAEGNTTASALTASVSLKAVDGEEDGSFKEKCPKPLQILPNQFNLPQVDFSQGAETTQQSSRDI